MVHTTPPFSGSPAAVTHGIGYCTDFRCATARSSKRAFIVPAADLCRAHVHLVSSCQKIDLNPTSLEKNSVAASPSACLRSQTAKVLQLYIRSQLDDLHVLALCPPSCRLTRGSVRVILRCEEKEMLAAARPQGSKKPERRRCSQIICRSRMA